MHQLINGNTMTIEEMPTKMIQTEIPIGLLSQAEDLVEAGWFRNLDDLMLDALRRFLESHRGELMEEFIRQDVEWGLTGNE
jgi:Arc/MetJ-type ribon-helix-helix transcriptional regulator